MSVDENNKDLSKRPVPQPPKHPQPDTQPEPAPGAPHPDWPIKESTKRLPDILPKKPFEAEKMPEWTTADSGPPPSEPSGTTPQTPTPPPQSPWATMGTGAKILFIIFVIGMGLVVISVISGNGPSTWSSACHPSPGYVSCGRDPADGKCDYCPKGNDCAILRGVRGCCADAYPYFYNGACNSQPQNNQQSSGGTSSSGGGVYKGTMTIRGTPSTVWCQYDIALRYTQSGNTVQGTIQQDLLRAGHCIGQYDSNVDRVTSYPVSGTISNNKIVIPAKTDCGSGWEFVVVNANTLSGTMVTKGCEYRSGGYVTTILPERSEPFTLTK